MQNHFILIKWGCPQKTRLQKVKIWPSYELFCVNKIFLRFLKNFITYVIVPEFPKFRMRPTIIYEFRFKTDNPDPLGDRVKDIGPLLKKIISNISHAINKNDSIFLLLIFVEVFCLSIFEWICAYILIFMLDLCRWATWNVF